MMEKRFSNSCFIRVHPRESAAMGFFPTPCDAAKLLREYGVS
jgi:hypothetical protein